jgi:FRG domain
MRISGSSTTTEDEFKLAFLSCDVSNHFESLGECIHSLRVMYEPPSYKQGWPHKADNSSPAYLFRGESGIFDSTYSGKTRIDIDFSGRKEKEQRKLSEMIRYCTQRLSLTIHGFSPDERVAFLQHYGLPTYAVDTTSDLETAAYFGSFGDTERVKLIAVINTGKLLKEGLLPIDLSSGRFGSRPAKQHTFSVCLGNRDNLKSRPIMDRLDIKWYSYILTEGDKYAFNMSRRYLSQDNNSFMSLLPLFIKEFESANGKIYSKIRQYYTPNMSPIFKM